MDLQACGMCQFTLVVVCLGVCAAEFIIPLRAEDGAKEIVKVLARRQLLATRQSVLAFVHAHLLNGLSLRSREENRDNDYDNNDSYIWKI